MFFSEVAASVRKGQTLDAVVSHHIGVFFASAVPRRIRASAGVYILFGVAAEPKPRKGTRIGEVWTSPCRESPRLPRCSQQRGGNVKP